MIVYIAPSYTISPYIFGKLFLQANQSDFSFMRCIYATVIPAHPSQSGRYLGDSRGKGDLRSLK
jgi:hypothetical protein